MSTEIDITLNELAQIALGTPEFTDVNIAILHSLFNVLLKKLSSPDECVNVSGFEGKSLEEELAASRISPFVVNHAQISLFEDKMIRLDALEAAIAKMEEKLKNHFDEMRKCNNKMIPELPAENRYPYYEHACEDMCIFSPSCNMEITDQESPHQQSKRIACNLIENKFFKHKLLHIIGVPLKDRLIEVERSIETLNHEFKAFLKRCKNMSTRIEQIENCVRQIEFLKLRMNVIVQKFSFTMQELQDMLKSKLDKVHVPVLKRYVKKHLASFSNCLDYLESKPPCPVVKPFSADLPCLSCCGSQVFAENFAMSVSPLPDMGYTRLKNKKKCYCNCYDSFANEQTLQQAIEKLNLGAVETALHLPKRRSCKLSDDIISMSAFVPRSRGVSIGAISF